jgi:hypothetical protein
LDKIVQKYGHHRRDTNDVGAETPDAYGVGVEKCDSPALGSAILEASNSLCRYPAWAVMRHSMLLRKTTRLASAIHL